MPLVDKWKTAGLWGVADAVARRYAKGPHPITRALTLLSTRDHFTLIQIGAYRGDSDNDPLCRFLRRIFDPLSPEYNRRARAVLVEPWPSHFDALCANYAHLSGVQFVEAAITRVSGPVSFGGLDGADIPLELPNWVPQLGSLDPERRIAQLGTVEHQPAVMAFVKAHTVMRTVRGLSYADLLRESDVASGEVDLVQIDAEGADYDILTSIDFRISRPAFVNYESTLLGRNTGRALRRMLRYGYRPMPYFQDTFCAQRRHRLPEAASVYAEPSPA